MIIIKPEQLLQIIITKPEQLLQIIIIKPEQLLLAPSSSPWPQWLIPKIIFFISQFVFLFQNRSFAEKNPDIFQIRPHRRRRGPQICRYLNHTFTEYHDDEGDEKGKPKNTFLCDFKKSLEKRKSAKNLLKAKSRPCRAMLHL